MNAKTRRFAAAAAIGLALTVPSVALAAGETYTLTYPDGSVVTTIDKAEAERLQDEWKLLYTGETDSDGNIVLAGWAESGQIRIVETEVPEGYTADATETMADLKDGSVTIVNRKDEEPEPGPLNPSPTSSSKPTKAAPRPAGRVLPRTGDFMGLVPWPVVAGAGIGLVAVAVVLRRRSTKSK